MDVEIDRNLHYHAYMSEMGFQAKLAINAARSAVKMSRETDLPMGDTVSVGVERFYFKRERTLG